MEVLKEDATLVWFLYKIYKLNKQLVTMYLMYCVNNNHYNLFFTRSFSFYLFIFILYFIIILIVMPL